MSTSHPLNGHAEYDAEDWQASLDYAADQERHPWPPRDLRSPCQNPLCDTLTEACFCCEHCREQTEGPDHELDDEEEPVPMQAPVVASPLPEAPVSMNVHLTISGRDVLVTLRGTDLQAVLQQMETLLQRYPVAPVAAAPAQALAGKDWCQVHNTQMKEQHGKDGSTWYSHKMADGWCKGKGGSRG